MELINISINLNEDQSLFDYLSQALSEFTAIWRHIQPIGHHSQDYQDESCWDLITIPIYTGYGTFYNLENIEDDQKRKEAYNTADNCLKDFLHIFTGKDDIQIKENMSINLTSDRELINITLSDNLIHIYYINSGQW